ncbi:mannose-specific lectin 3-like [Ananas comosus]|uniref:non-specific serine/threonine protein kinase n=1 Tax=Ananas comosus TaxID=4615 RepID=A0A6P5F0I1_ANACO|nr:mannose-specific lectin 3-like [Ananas comosus]
MVTLNNHGQFVVSDDNGSTLWTSELKSKTPRGRYAAVVRPDGQVSIYGPAVSATLYFPFLTDSREFPENVYMRVGRSVLFSGQILHDGQMQQSRGSELMMSNDCGLTLITSLLGMIWQSPTGGRGWQPFQAQPPRPVDRAG